MLYHWYELGHAAVHPARAAAKSYRRFISHPYNPLAHSRFGQHAAAACEVFERTTRRYEKPEFGIRETTIAGETIAVDEECVWEKPFCRLIHFKRNTAPEVTARDPSILLVAPMSGHFATLLRGTVEALIPNHNVYITDWSDASTVPASDGLFDLDDYIDYVIDILNVLKGDVHVVGVCQPSVPVLAAVARMEADNHPNAPWSMTLIGGPIDTRINPTAVNKVVETKSLNWFRNNVITGVPWSFPGAGRSVYPGFMQLSGFMSMNLDRHARAHHDFFDHLVEGDGDSAEKHREFYDEYLAVMDLTAEFYLQTIETVFMRHAIATGDMRHRGRPVDPSKIERVALMTIEGEKDDITGLGQCRAAQDLCASIPQSAKYELEAKGVGHYGLFNGRRFRTEIAPRIAQFVRCHDPKGDDSACALLRKFKPASPKPLSKSSPTATPVANDTSSAADSAKLPTCGVTANVPANAFADQSPLLTAIELWHISHGTVLKSAWRLMGASASASTERKTPSKVRDGS